MSTYYWMFGAWGLITLGLVILLIYRSRLTGQETDWIPLSNVERGERAIQAQMMIEMKAKKLTWPIRTLATLSVALLLAILGFWLYSAFTTSPPAVIE